MKFAKYKFRSAVAAFLCLLCSVTGTLAYEILYSPADSILYLQYLSPHPYLFRFRDGGSRIERAVEAAPGMIIAFDAIPGHLFVHDEMLPNPDFKSTDYGESWESCATFPNRYIWGHNPYMGWCGELPGQSQIYNGQRLFVTSDSWLTYDSIEINRYSEEAQDSLGLASLSYRVGLCYALTRQNHFFVSLRIPVTLGLSATPVRYTINLALERLMKCGEGMGIESY